MARYSHSRIKTFENCPLNYKLQYIDKIPRGECESIEAFLGSRFHEVMEKLYGELRFKTRSLDELLKYYDECWKKKYNENVFISRKDRTAEDYKNLGRKCIVDYYKKYQPFSNSRILDVERKITISLDDEGQYNFGGIIDRLDLAPDGAFEIHDYKTSGSIPAQKELDEDWQLALYQIGVQDAWPDAKNVRLVWHYVAFDMEMTSSRTKKQLEALKKDVIKLIDKIENTKEFLPKESALCSWCEYPDICPMKKHLYKVEALPVNEYLKDDGVKLVNKYSKLNEQKKENEGKMNEIEEEMEKVKEAIVAYSDKEKVSVIAGSGHKIKISRLQKFLSPAKNTPEREQLYELLRKENKWDEASTLDTHALEIIVKEKKWSEKLTGKIMKFLNISDDIRLTLSKLKDKEK